jgi:Uma2 family endonuclease
MEMLAKSEAVEAAKLVGLGHRPMTRAEFMKLGEDGFFDDERVELLFGVVVEMSPNDPAHDTSVYWVAKRLDRAIGERAIVRTQSSFAAREDSQPLPDVVVAPNEPYWTEHPTHAFLIVEVARSSVRKDRGPKKLLYGITSVDEYWIVNHVSDSVEVYRDHGPLGWKTFTSHARGETLRPLRFPDVTIAVDDLLPPKSISPKRKRSRKVRRG